MGCDNNLGLSIGIGLHGITRDPTEVNRGIRVEIPGENLPLNYLHWASPLMYFGCQNALRTTMSDYSVAGYTPTIIFTTGFLCTGLLASSIPRKPLLPFGHWTHSNPQVTHPTEIHKLLKTLPLNFGCRNHGRHPPLAAAGDLSDSFFGVIWWIRSVGPWGHVQCFPSLVEAWFDWYVMICLGGGMI